MSDLFQPSAPTPPALAEDSLLIRFFGHVGAGFLRGMQYLGGTSQMLARSFYWAFIHPFFGRRLKSKHLAFQMERIGFKSIPIVFLVILFVGMIIALQMAYVLRQFGVIDYVASVISVSMVRELGPLITAVVMSGFAGASIAAELGTMRDREEILALETIGLNPIAFLVVPRMLATIIMMPCLTLLANMVGILGGYAIAVWTLDVNPSQFYARAIQFLKFKDIYVGLLKAGVFGLLISLISCYEGFSVEGGAEGVGRATTRSVVVSIIAVITADCVITTIFYFLMERNP